MTVTFLHGDVIEQLRGLPADSFDCVVTSPPYWGLRDYGVEGQLGMEPTLGEHIEVMVRVCDEIRRVLKPTGTFWLNYGDCYATSPNGRSAADTKAAGKDDRTFRDKPFGTTGPIYAPGPNDPFGKKQGLKRRGGGNNSDPTLKPKDLCMVPNRLAIALQEDGWWVRSEIIWGKPNPMPDSSGRYRPSTSHEKIFMLVKSKAYFYDSEAVRVTARTEGEYKTPDGWDTTVGDGGHGTIAKTGRFKGQSVAEKRDKQRGHARSHQGFNERWDQMSRAEQQANGRLLRNYEPAPVQVWEMATRPFSEAHFATFPPDLVERCLRAGCPSGGAVLDPFGGAGTTGLVADRLQFDCTLIDLNPEYIDMAKRRIACDGGLFFNEGKVPA